MEKMKMLRYVAGGQQRSFELTDAQASGLGKTLAEYAAKGAILEIEIGTGPTPVWLNPSQWSEWMIA